MKEYEVIVVGGGPGGYVAAIKAAQAGLSVALVEKDELGGTCLNRGCIPTKTLMYASHLWKELNCAGELGIEVEGLRLDIRKIYNRKEQVAAKLREGIAFLLKSNRVDWLKGVGTIAENHVVKVQLEEQLVKLTGKNIIIATGAVPVVPPIEGITLPGVMTSNELLDQTEALFKKLVVIGGGVIGVEFATIFQALGCEVTIIEARERLLPTMDREISQNLSMILKKRGIGIYSSAMLEVIRKNAEGLAFHYIQKGSASVAEADAALIAVGRQACCEGLFSQELRIEQKQGIVVDEHFATSIPGIYAIGDVIAGGIQLAHAASAQGICAVAHICGKTPAASLAAVPSCIYTDPEIAVVGMDAATAKAKGIAVRMGKYSMTGNGKSVIERQERGFIKILAEADTDVILGAQLMCARATDLVSELSTAIVNRLTVDQLAAVIRPHPTFAEGVTEAVGDINDTAIHIVPKG